MGIVTAGALFLATPAFAQERGPARWHARHREVTEHYLRWDRWRRMREAREWRRHHRRYDYDWYRRW